MLIQLEVQTLGCCEDKRIGRVSMRGLVALAISSFSKVSSYPPSGTQGNHPKVTIQRFSAATGIKIAC